MKKYIQYKIMYSINIETLIISIKNLYIYVVSEWVLEERTSNDVLI